MSDDDPVEQGGAEDPVDDGRASLNEKCLRSLTSFILSFRIKKTISSNPIELLLSLTLIIFCSDDDDDDDAPPPPPFLSIEILCAFSNFKRGEKENQLKLAKIEEGKESLDK